uniref:Uncharacterized protein n=1 Tax=Rhizophora mucronata TaxID=61149 RepID=A0A2P2JSM1_RHIMU
MAGILRKLPFWVYCFQFVHVMCNQHIHSSTTGDWCLLHLTFADSTGEENQRCFKTANYVGSNCPKLMESIHHSPK